MDKKTAEADRSAKTAADVARRDERKIWREKEKTLEARHYDEQAAQKRYIRILERQIDALSAAPPKDEPSIGHPLPIAEKETVNPDNLNKIKFPEEGVVFLGGWESIQNNIRKAHPQWTIIGVDGAERLRIGPSTKLAFSGIDTAPTRQVKQSFQNYQPMQRSYLFQARIWNFWSRK